MKQSQIYGLVAIGFGVLIMALVNVPFFAIIHTDPFNNWRNANYFPIFRILEFTDTGFTVFWNLTAIFGLISFALGILLIGFGAMLLLGKWDRLLKFYKPMMALVSLVVLATGIFALIQGASFRGNNQFFWRGAHVGAYFFTVLGAVGILHVLKKRLWTKQVSKFVAEFFNPNRRFDEEEDEE
ncbi:MAG: hypothetical protein FWE31_02730 [Firmicutes bacterium]|nr:hypothetical protein [Bacillota bacterium]